MLITRRHSTSTAERDTPRKSTQKPASRKSGQTIPDEMLVGTDQRMNTCSCCDRPHISAFFRRIERVNWYKSTI